MHAGVSRSSLISVAVTLGLAVALATEISGTSAAGRSVSAGAVSSIELGPSQEAVCKRITPADRIIYGQCTSAKQILALMRAERRDNMWADKTEVDLRKWVESLASEDFVLRNVACRLSWCIVEVGSTGGRILEEDSSHARKWRLFDALNLFAPDVGDPNVEDQLTIYKRYCNSAAELFDGNGHLVPNFVTVGKNC